MGLSTTNEIQELNNTHYKIVRDKTTSDAYMNVTIQNMFIRGELRKDHPLQRKPNQWTDSDKSGLVATIIKHEDVDSVKVCEQLTENGVILWLIDGIQRLTALSSYRQGMFKLSRSIEFPIIVYQSIKKDDKGNIVKNDDGSYIYEMVDYDLRGKYYKDLPEELKERFDNCKIDMVKHLNCTNEEIGYHIRRYNKQKSMNASQSAVTYMDNIAKYVKRVSENTFFKNDAYKEKDRINGTIDRIVMESVMSMFHLDNWKKGKSMGTYLNNNSNKNEFEKLNDNLNRINSIYIDDFSSVFTARDSFIWFTIFDKFSKLGIDDVKFSDFLKHFLNISKGKSVEEFYTIDSKSSTKDKTIIRKKISKLEELMLDFLHVNKADIKDIDILEFVKSNVNSDVDDNDIEQYIEVLNDLTLNVDNSSKLLDSRNNPSLIGIVSYSFKNDIDLDDWIVDYFKRNNTYILNQKENYIHMKSDLDKFVHDNDKKTA